MPASGGPGHYFLGQPRPQGQGNDHGDKNADGDGYFPIGYWLLHALQIANVVPFSKSAGFWLFCGILTLKIVHN